MTISVGTTIGSYEVLSIIGAGGMGEVYRARDTRLQREVAIKVLPADRVTDEARRRRFLQEARAASALNHPHIVTIHEIESIGDLDFIVMEYVRGRSLDLLIPRTGLRLPELLRIAIAVADALAAAHAKGIIHRDLKPANVIVGHDGAVKVVDFGLAKLLDEVEPEAETRTYLEAAGLTAPGVIAGTAAYMSPEQAVGGKVDARSDIYSFGAMLYEMATGRRPFEGSRHGVPSTAGADPTPPTRIVPTLPRELERVILRCLRREPERRFHSMVDVKIELQELKEESDSGAAAPGVPVSPPRRRRYVVVSLVLVACLAVVAVWLLRRDQGFVLGPPRVVPLTTLPGLKYAPSLSPDGEQVAFVWNGEREDNFDIYLKMVGASDVRRLTTAPEPDHVPSWSPDGRQIAFVRVREPILTLYLISPVSGAERKLIDFPVDSRPSWSPDGSALAVTRRRDEEGRGIYLIPVQGDAPQALTRAEGTWQHLSPAFSPDGRRLAYAACRAVLNCDIEVLTLGDDARPVGQPRTLIKVGKRVDGLEWSRDARSIVYGVQETGVHVFLWRVAVEREPVPTRLDLAGLGAWTPSIARHRDRLAFEVWRAVESIHPLDWTLTSPPVLSSTAEDSHPSFSPDGTHVAFSSSRSGEAVNIWIAAADGSGARQLTSGPGKWQGSPAWSPDGRLIAFDAQQADGHWGIWTIDVDGGTPRQVTTDPGDENMPTWSGDGRWIYFISDQGRGRDVWRIPASGGTAERITHDGAGLVYAFESPDGASLLYKPSTGESALLAIPLAGGRPREVVRCTTDTFVVARGGIYYAECGPGPERVVRLLDWASGEDRPIGKVGAGLGPDRPAVSPDGTVILTHRQRFSVDLMLIENFR